MSPLVEYLHAVHLIRATGAGTKETSYYTPLEDALDESYAAARA